MKCSFYVVLPSLISIIILISSCNKNSNTQSTTKTKCVTCANGGACINDTCRCPSGYEGVSCQTTTRTKFIGSWVVHEKGTLVSERQYDIQIESNFSSDINTIQFSNFYNFFFFSPVTGYVSSDSLYIPSQHLQGKIIVGTGYIHSDPTFGQFGAITMRYMVTDSLTGSIDDFGYNSSANGTSEWVK